jgi:hypothetical protein
MTQSWGADHCQLYALPRAFIEVFFIGIISYEKHLRYPALEHD